jgi:26S proteasome non-ATPase regulatory subunit 10
MIYQARKADCRLQPNVDGQVAEEIEGVGGEEQKRVRQFVVSKVGPRDQ